MPEIEPPEGEGNKPTTGDENTRAAETAAEEKRTAAEIEATSAQELQDAVNNQIIDGLIGDSYKANMTRAAESAKGFGMTDAEVGDLNKAFDDLGEALDEAIKTEGGYPEALKKLQDDLWKPTDDASQAALKKFLEKNTGALYDQLGKIDPDIGKTFIKKMNDSGLTMMDDAPKDAVASQELRDKVEQAVTDAIKEHPEAESKFNEKQVDKEGAEAAKGEKTGTSLTFDKWLKALGLLMLMGEIGFGIWALLEYCNDHSGCMEVANDGQNPETSNKVFCTDNVTFQPQQCMCSNPPTALKQIVTALCSKNDDITMVPEINNPKCQNNVNYQPPYNYYAYRVMGPLDGIIDLGDRIIDDGGKFLDTLMKFIKWLALVIGILGLLYIIFLIVRAGINHSEKKSIK